MAYLHEVWAILRELAPWLFLGAAVGGFLHAFVPRGLIRRQLGGRGIGPVVKASLVGVPMPLCSCSVIPTGLGLKKDGASDGATVSFLVSTPQTGVDSLLVAAAFLGWPFALFKFAAAFVTGVVGGAWANLAGREGGPIPAEPEGPGSCCHDDACGADGNDPDPAPRGLLARLREGARFAFADLLGMIWGWLAIGILVSAALTLWLDPGELIGTWFATGVVAMAVMLLISLPLYVCAVASVPIAAALVHAGMPTGAALVFLMAGPATNVATIGAIYRVLGGRVTGVYLAVVIVGSVGLGWAYADPHVHGEEGWFFDLAAGALALTIAAFALRDAWRRLRRDDVHAERVRAH